MYLRILVLGLLIAGAVPAADVARANLLGRWQSSAADQPNWVFEQKDDLLSISRSEGDKKTAAFECNTVGRDCKFKEGGKEVTVSMWFSGPTLVQIETIGQTVTKRRFTVLEDGALQVELIPVVPAGKTETVKFNKVIPAAPAEPGDRERP